MQEAWRPSRPEQSGNAGAMGKKAEKGTLGQGQQPSMPTKGLGTQPHVLGATGGGAGSSFPGAPVRAQSLTLTSRWAMFWLCRNWMAVPMSRMIPAVLPPPPCWALTLWFCNPQAAPEHSRAQWGEAGANHIPRTHPRSRECSRASAGHSGWSPWQSRSR